MTVQACYEAMDGDCAAALEVLGSEERVRRYLLRFAEDPTARMLLAALGDGRFEDARRAAHTLKGLCRGLGLSGLYGACCALSEALCMQSRDSLSQPALGLRQEYTRTMRAIEGLKGR